MEKLNQGASHSSHNAGIRMKLEIITKIPQKRILTTPIVLIHGAWHAAWCWEGNFLDYFPSRGWETHAISLRGHGQSDGAATLHSTSAKRTPTLRISYCGYPISSIVNSQIPNRVS